MSTKVEKKLNGEFKEVEKQLDANNDAFVDAVSEKIDTEMTDAKTNEQKEHVAGTRTGSVKLKAPKPKKKKVSQKGINNTVESARRLNKALGTYMPAYVSNIPALELEALDEMYADGRALEKAVVVLESKNTVNLNKRRRLYKGLNRYAAMIVSQIKACGADKETVKDANNFLKEMRGVRIIPINPNVVGALHISPSHTGHADKLETFGKLIEVAENFPGYAVVTGNLSSTAIRAHYGVIDEANDAADTSGAELDAARRNRNAYFNTEITGLVDTYLRVKDNVKALYGTTSKEYNAIKGIPFTRISEKYSTGSSEPR